jgi:hypothetical protein
LARLLKNEYFFEFNSETLEGRIIVVFLSVTGVAIKNVGIGVGIKELSGNYIPYKSIGCLFYSSPASAPYQSFRYS